MSFRVTISGLAERLHLSLKPDFMREMNLCIPIRHSFIGYAFVESIPDPST
jgi:hypothetical protein